MRIAPRQYLFLAALPLALALLWVATGGALAIARSPQTAVAPFGPSGVPGTSEGVTDAGGPTLNGSAVSLDLPNKIYLPALTRQYSSTVEDVQGTVSPTGAELKLNSGVTLSIPPGSVSAPVSISFSKIVTDATLTNPNLALFEVSASGPVGSASITVPLPPGARPNHLAAFYRPANSNSVVPITGTVSAGGDSFTIPLVSSSAAQGRARTVQGVASGTYGIEGDIQYSYSKASYVMDIPYYEQDGENCWATVWLMFLKSYGTQTGDASIYKLLSLAKVEKNEGLLWFQEGTIASLTRNVFGIAVEKNWWLSYNNFVDFVVKSLDEGRPVYVHMGTHQGLFVGYEIADVGGPNETVSLVYHDPQNWLDQVAYRKVSAAQLKSQFWQYTAPFITLTGPPLSQAPSLQTIHMPDGRGAYSVFTGVGFGRKKPIPSVIVDEAIWDHTTPSGYRLEKDEVPRDLTDIILGDIPVWNMDRNKSADVTITSRVKGEFGSADHYSWETLYVTTTQATVAPGSRYKYGVVVPAVDLYKSLLQSSAYSDTTKFKVTTELQSGGSFEVEFKHRPLYLRSITYSSPPWEVYSGSIGDERVLNGLGFGVSQGSSAVTFNGVPAEVLSWSNVEIKVKVPKGATTGDVKVTVGSDNSNAIAFTIAPTVFGMVSQEGYAPLGSQVVITGTGFGSMIGSVTISQTLAVTGTLATIDEWTTTEITFTVPLSLKVGENARVDLKVGPDSFYVGTLGIVESLQEALRRSTSVQGLFLAMNRIANCLTGCTPAVSDTNQAFFDVRSSNAVSSTLSWSGNGFNLSGTNPSGGKTDINGSISVSTTQSLTGTVSASFSYSYLNSSANEFGSTRSTETRKFTISDLPLRSYVPLSTGSSSTSVDFGLRGQAVQSYISGQEYESTYKQTFQNTVIADLYSRYLLTVWDSDTYSPTLSVIFIVPSLP